MEHPINVLDSMIDILGDALVVSPVIQSGDSNARLSNAQSNAANSATLSQSTRRHHHVFNFSKTSSNVAGSSSRSDSIGSSTFSSTFNPKTFFYVNSYLSEHSGYSQRLGCQHGEDLPFILGAPLFDQLISPITPSLFHINYTRQDATLSEAVMTYWINFAKFG